MRRLSVLLVCLSLQQSVWAKSALQDLTTEIQKIEMARKTTMKSTSSSRKAIDKIHGIVTGHNRSINYNKRATSAEFEAVMSGFLSEHFHRQNEKVEVPRLFYVDFIESSERQYTHASMVLIAYLSAKFAARHKEVYFLTAEQCAERIHSKLQKLMLDPAMDVGFKKYLVTLKDTREHIKDKSTQEFIKTALDHFDFFKLVRKYSQGYQDVSHQWLIESSTILRKKYFKKHEDILQEPYWEHKKRSQQKPMFVMVEDLKNHLPLILNYFKISNEHYFKYKNHTFFDQLDTIKDILHRLEQKRLGDLRKIYQDLSDKRTDLVLKDGSILKVKKNGFRHGNKPLMQTLVLPSQLKGTPFLPECELYLGMSIEAIKKKLHRCGLYQ